MHLGQNTYKDVQIYQLREIMRSGEYHLQVEGRDKQCTPDRSGLGLSVTTVGLQKEVRSFKCHYILPKIGFIWFCQKSKPKIVEFIPSIGEQYPKIKNKTEPSSQAGTAMMICNFFGIR